MGLFHRNTASRRHEIGMRDYECCGGCAGSMLASSQRAVVANPCIDLTT
jgi:hypothetical protein